jgi:2-keto-4-pentenoate hydratase/2-oxohepta-3-ene-1,7-dioic acid hydratase in catechol pathway
MPALPKPSKVICAGANYYKHLAEMNVSYTKDATKPPFFFLKPPTALAGRLVLDPAITMLDWEVEMVAVIGRGGRDIALAQALEHVAGYTVAVDVTARDRLMQPDSIFKFDFLSGKGRDGYCPIAPTYVPAAELGDPQTAHLRLAVNGVMKQDASTSDMIYSTAELISWASRMMTLEPGDFLLTGSPDGVGFPRREFLKVGDVMTVELAPHLSFTSEVCA